MEARNIAQAAPYFFLSYPRSSENVASAPRSPDAWLIKLFDDLCCRITELSGLPSEAAKHVGFMDREQRAGPDARRVQLARSLATCRVFVPLLSQRYFESHDCGREWFAFTRRVLDNAARGHGRAGVIVPALWVPLDARPLPQAVRDVQLNHTDLGECYAANGFYGLIKLTRYRDAYENAVDGLARLIVQAAAESTAAPAQVTDYASLASAFGSEAGPIPGSRPLRITLVAPRRAELPREAGALYYGHDARSWSPYAPEAVCGLADHAAELARRLGFSPDVGDLLQHGHELLKSGPPACPEVLIVDAWAATLDCYASLLRRLDAMNKPWVQVVVPWKRGDRQNEAASARLWSALGSALGHKLTEGRATSLAAVRGVPTADDFSRVLPTVIMTAARQYLRHAQPFRRRPFPR